MKTKRTEAIDIFRTWLADGLLVRWEGKFSTFAFSSWGKVVSLDNSEIRFMSGDNGSELIVRFASDVEFGYGDNRNDTEPKQFADCILIFFGPVPPTGDADRISLFAAIPD